jgi:UDP-N-acetylglucosamine 2-epimerase
MTKSGKGKLKVISILGTRPEIIKMSCVLKKADEYFNHKILFTQQSYDFEMSTIFFDELQVRKPDFMLSVKADTLGGQIANVITQTEKIFIEEKPDAILLLGDTNSGLAAMVARRMKIMIFHMEAGNRSFDRDVPEEVNRKIIDHISDVNLPYTEHARTNLLREGIHPGAMYVTGSPMAEVLENYKDEIDKSDVLKEMDLKEQEYFLASIHREDNVDVKERLLRVIEALNVTAEKYKLPVIVSLHPRTKKKLEEFGVWDKISPLVKLQKPLGFFEYVKLQKHALCVLSDSGTIQEESCMLGFRAIQVRKSSERPEAFDTGSIILSGHDTDTILAAIQLVVDERKAGLKKLIPLAYQDKNVSSKVVKLILGLASINRDGEYNFK